jgi:predicted RNA binding protein YcfA (HicA-like mRNA interferase family)
MTKVPSLSFDRVISALRRDGWVVVRQRGSHIRLQKQTRDETLKLTVPAHRPIKRSTLSHILKQARMMASQKVRPTALRRFFRTSTYQMYAFAPENPPGLVGRNFCLAIL